MISCLCFWWLYTWSTEKGGSAGVFTVSIRDMSWMPLLYFSGLNCTYFPWHFFLLKIYFPVPLYPRIFSLLGGNRGGGQSLALWLAAHAGSTHAQYCLLRTLRQNILLGGRGDVTFGETEKVPEWVIKGENTPPYAVDFCFCNGQGRNPSGFLHLIGTFSSAVFAPRRTHVRLTGRRTTLLTEISLSPRGCQFGETKNVPE